MRKKVVVLIVLVLISSFGVVQFAASQEGPPAGLIQEIQLFSKSMNAVLQGYVEDVKPRELFYEAAKGMMKSLDKYSEFIEPERFELLQIDIKGEYGGIGAELVLDEGRPAIGTIFPGSAAELGGVMVRDLILTVNGQDATEMSLPKIASIVRGEIGTEVTIVVGRGVPLEQIELVLVRAVIEVSAVRDVRIAGKAVGYARVVNFQDNTVEQFDEALDELLERGIKGLVIDLRNNTGGVLPAGIGMAERFLPEGKKIVTVKSKVDVQRSEHFSHPTRPIAKLDIVILVNEGSASASEVFSAAMQYHRAAKIVGAQTYGKASVQSVVPLDEDSALKLTTAKYLTPGGEVIDGIGIEPDVLIESRMNRIAGSDLQLQKALDLLKEHM